MSAYLRSMLSELMPLWMRRKSADFGASEAASPKPAARPAEAISRAGRDPARGRPVEGGDTRIVGPRRRFSH